MKLLVVDDDVHIRRIVALYLRDHDVAEAATAEEALERIASEHFDAVIVDLILPHFGGLRLCRKIKSAPAPPRVIVMSGDEQLREQAREAGADVFLAKPFTKDDLEKGLALGLGLGA
jgi:DNA-binding response OmpR family regulator